jgi:tripeptide aminopeptidase
MLLERFIKYVKVDTMSSEDANTTPSTKKQFDLAYLLMDELKELGLKDIKLNEHCILTATLPKNTLEESYTIGFIAHMDTIPGFSGTNVKPQIFTNYDGNKIDLKNNVSLDPIKFPFLNNLKGKTLITTDGTTVLGADDKAGVAIIMEMLEFFVNHPENKHTEIKVAFTPDEEIGGGIDSFDVKEFNADFAYTVDGGEYNQINYENFNAASALIKVNGLDIHPGSAKGQMINAASIACEFEMMLDEFAKPMYTEGYEGFNHLCEMSGNVTSATMDYILRNHDKTKLEKQKQSFIDITNKLNKKYGDNVVELTLKDSYSNMAEFIKKDPKSVEYAIKAMNKLGITEVIEPIRGGTDGAKLTLKGLNTPNLGTGGYNCHGPYECACLEEMEIVLNIIKEIAKI